MQGNNWHVSSQVCQGLRNGLGGCVKSGCVKRQHIKAMNKLEGDLLLKKTSSLFLFLSLSVFLNVDY